MGNIIIDYYLNDENRENDENHENTSLSLLSLFVTDLSSQTICINISNTATILDLKQKAVDDGIYPTHDINLLYLYSNRIIHDNESLSTIQNYTKFSMHVRIHDIKACSICDKLMINDRLDTCYMHSVHKMCYYDVCDSNNKLTSDVKARSSALCLIWIKKQGGFQMFNKDIVELLAKYLYKTRTDNKWVHGNGKCLLSH